MIARRTLFCKPRPVRPPNLVALWRRPPSERWTITFSGHDTTVPVVCRVRRLLKTAWRGYGLKAEIVAGPSTTTAPWAVSSPVATVAPGDTAQRLNRHASRPANEV